jgi:hypothetical protein
MQKYTMRVALGAFLVSACLSADDGDENAQEIRAEGRIWRMRPQRSSGRIEILSEIPGSISDVYYYPLNNLASPVISSTWEVLSGDEYRYGYVVGNDPRAREAIQSWKLLLPTAASPRDLSSPSQWQKGVIQSSIPTVPYSLESAPEGLIWTWYSLGRNMQPGQSASFSLASRFVPGLVFGYVKSPEGSTEGLSDLPSEVTKHLVKMIGLEHSSSPVWVIGPYYSPKLSLEDRARAHAKRFIEVAQLLEKREEKDLLTTMAERLTRYVSLGGSGSTDADRELCGEVFQPPPGRGIATEALTMVHAQFCRLP